jgi:2-dehydro-3-deoxyphosphooctonate aldolase (KDO 8-P synthase)
LQQPNQTAGITGKTGYDWDNCQADCSRCWWDFFIETHFDPANAKSDGQICYIDYFEALMTKVAIRKTINTF